MNPPEEVKLSREGGEALIERVKASNLASDDQGLVVKLIQIYFWLTRALQETKISLKRLKVALFGEGRKKRGPPGGGSGGISAGAQASPVPTEPLLRPSAAKPSGEEPSAERRRGHGRWGAEAYPGAEEVVCRHDALAGGQRCPACGRGTLYPLPAGIEIRIDGNALLTAVRYELEKLRCSACGQVFTAPLPAHAGEEKYTARAGAVLALSGYSLGVPFYRLEGFQALVGVPVADATQWDQAERVADCAYPVFEQMKRLAAQGEVIFQDDTHARILAVIKENRKAAEAMVSGQAEPRTGMYTTSLVANAGEWTICLYFAGRAHAGENLEEILTLREPERGPPIGMSDALSVNTLDDEGAIIRSHCLAHGRRKFTEIEEVFPADCQRVIDDLNRVFEPEATTRQQGLTAAARLAYHQTHSGPILDRLKSWLEDQVRERLVEPNSSLGKAFQYLLNHWHTLTQFLRVPGAPLDNNTVERALKLMIRQRRNSLFYASTHSAYVASLLTSVIATCAQAGINALAYLVALQEHRAEVFRNPSAWLPWNYTEQLVPV
jgi:transposase